MVTNRAKHHSLMKPLISGEIVLIRVSKPKANTLTICYDVLLHNYQLVAGLILQSWLWCFLPRDAYA